MMLNRLLAFVDAAFTSVALVCLLLGYQAIRRRQIDRHKRLMLTAFFASALFLAVFVARFAMFGFAKFQGTGVARGVYLGIFLSHEPLAVVNIPLAIAALVLGLRGSFAAHREVARFAFPMWVYVATTGLLLYVMLYVL
jgi:putative membrane protein